MTTPSELSTILKENGLETLNVDIESEDTALEGLTMERLKRAMQNAFDAGQAIRQKESIEANVLFWQLMESLPDHVYFKDKRSRFSCINHSKWPYYYRLGQCLDDAFVSFKIYNYSL